MNVRNSNDVTPHSGTPSRQLDDEGLLARLARAAVAHDDFCDGLALHSDADGSVVSRLTDFVLGFDGVNEVPALLASSRTTSEKHEVFVHKVIDD